jgi:hypothetical protein
MSTSSPYRDRSNSFGKDQKLASKESLTFREFKQEEMVQTMQVRWEQGSGAGMRKRNTGEYE